MMCPVSIRTQNKQCKFAYGFFLPEQHLHRGASQILRNSSNLLFRNDFDRADRRIVDGRSEVDFDFALGRGFNVLK
jgi:hypothetical protein